MRQRCLNPSDSNFGHYGGRGITICQRWRDSFRSFLEDMGERPPGKSLDRIDVNGPYSPENCRWATPREQSLNRRSYTPRIWWTRLFTHNGITDSIAGWADRLGVRRESLRHRINRGWSFERAVSTPFH